MKGGRLFSFHVELDPDSHPVLTRPAFGNWPPTHPSQQKSQWAMHPSWATSSQLRGDLVILIRGLCEEQSLYLHLDTMHTNAHQLTVAGNIKVTDSIRPSQSLPCPVTKPIAKNNTEVLRRSNEMTKNPNIICKNYHAIRPLVFLHNSS